MKNNNVHTQLKGGPNQTWSHKTKAILFKGLEHLRIWVSTEDPGTTIPMDVAG